MTIDDVKIIELPKFLDVRGNLSFAEQFSQIPFEIQRVYWIYDVPGGEERGGHAFRENEEVIISLSGAFDVIVDDDIQKLFADYYYDKVLSYPSTSDIFTQPISHGKRMS